MLSTYVTYRLQTQDLNRTMTRVAAEPQVARDVAYFKANIGSVKDVDAFLGNSRLYNFAMKAYGLEDMSYAKAFMKKVLTSDLTDTSSFANKLSDKRYIEFARAFNFTSSKDGANLIDLQSDAQAKDTLNLYSAHVTRLAGTAATATTTYLSAIVKVTSVDRFLADSTLRDYALAAVGLDKNTSNTILRQVLTGDTSAIPATTNPAKALAWEQLSQSFNFQSDGSVAPGDVAQTSSQRVTLTGLYQMQINDGITQPGADAATAYYTANIGNVTSVADLIADPHLTKFVLTSVGLDPANISASTLTKILQSDRNDPNSFANLGNASFKALVNLFAFNTDGSLPSGTPAQTEAQITQVSQGFNAKYNLAQQTADRAETTYFKAHIEKVTSVTDLVNDHRMFAYLVTAYDLDPATTPAKLKESLVLNPTDLSNKLAGSNGTGLRQLVADFNFDASGKVSAQRTVQPYKDIFATISAYTSAAAQDPKTTSTSVKAESTYYQTKIAKVQSLDELLADKRLVTYLTTAYGVPANMQDKASLKKIFTADINSPSSLINQPGNESLRTMSAAFNFDTKGAVVAQASTQPQDAKDTPITTKLYLQQQLEQEIGQTSEGTRLALYFRRVAPNVKSVFDLLADKAMLQVVQTALGLPAASATASIDAQANLIKQKLNIADLRDGAKLERFISRFSALYDVNSQSAAQDPTVSLFSGNSGAPAVGENLIGSLQSFKTPR